MKTIKHYLVTCLLLCFFSSLLSQNITRNINAADKAFYEYNFKKSLKKYMKVLEVDTSAHVIRGIAQSYAYLQLPEESSKYFKMLAATKDPLPFDILEYAQSLKRVGNYDEALVWFEKYREIYPLDLRARNHSVNSYHYKKLARNKKNPHFFSLDINDEGSVMGFTPYEGGIIFSKSENNGSFDFMDSPEVFLDMLQAELTDEMEFEKIKYMPFHLNSDMHDGPSSYHSPTKTLAFTRNADLTKETREEGVQLEIHFSTKGEKDKWSDPIPFAYNSSEHSVGHPSMSPDGNKLYFISNQPGGFGGTDIYVTEKLGKEWSTPVNLGPEINTEADEMFPFITHGDVLYFSTEGHAGLGGLDIFKTYPFEDFWAKPENLGAPVNSRADDFGLVMIKEGEALFSSERVGSLGADDAYYVNLQETKKFFTIPAKLIENDNVSPISVVNLSTGQEEFHKMGESNYLELDVSDTGYNVSWLHMGEARQIYISGKKNDLGALEIDFSGLDGLEANDFLSQIDIIGAEETHQVRIDQKVWTYSDKPADGFMSDVRNEPTNYAKGKDNVIILTDSGEELRAESYPQPSPENSKTIIYLEDQTAEINFESFENQLAKFCEAYQSEDEEYVTIRLIKSDQISPLQIEAFGNKVESYIIEKGIPTNKIQLEWIESTAELDGEQYSNDFEIYITIDTKFSLAE